MSIAQLKEFFDYEGRGTECIDDILILLNAHKESVNEQMKSLQKAYAHLLKKLHYYGDIKKSLETNQPLPEWKDYKFKTFTEEDNQ